MSENASDKFGGEAILPLNYFLMLRRRNIDVWLLTNARVRDNLLKIAEVDQSKVVYTPNFWVFRWLDALGAYFPDRLRLISTQFLMDLISQCWQWFVVRNLIKQHGINLVHQPTPVSTSLPSMIFGFGLPVVIGPMNGGMSFPYAFKRMASIFERIVYVVLRFSAPLVNLLIPGKLFAKILLVANVRSKEVLPPFYLGRVETMIENGVWAVAERVKVKSTKLINILFVGRLVDWKCVDMLIDAFYQCKLVNAQLTIVGDGKERQALEKRVQELSAEHISFVGQVSFFEINQYYDSADIFVLPSVRECGGAVVLEAMSRGLPVIATNWGGPSDYITPETGILIEPISREYMVEKLAYHITTLANDSKMRGKLGSAAIDLVKQRFTWDKKIDDLVDLYKTVI